MCGSLAGGWAGGEPKKQLAGEGLPAVRPSSLACSPPSRTAQAALPLSSALPFCYACPQRTSLEARQQDIRDKQVAVQQSGEHVEKLKASLACPGCASSSWKLSSLSRCAAAPTFFTLALCPAHTLAVATQPNSPPLFLHTQALLRESQAAGERLQKEYNSLAERAARLHHSLEDHVHTNTQLLADNSQRQVEIKARDDEIRALRVSGWKGGCGCPGAAPAKDCEVCLRPAVQHRRPQQLPAAYGPEASVMPRRRTVQLLGWVSWCQAAAPAGDVPSALANPQEEGARAAKAREHMSARLQQLEKQKGEVEAARDELKVGGHPGERRAAQADCCIQPASRAQPGRSCLLQGHQPAKLRAAWSQLLGGGPPVSQPRPLHGCQCRLRVLGWSGSWRPP